MSKNTKIKYYNFMMQLYTQKEFDIKEMMREHRIGSRVITLLRESNMIKRDGKYTKWIAEQLQNWAEEEELKRLDAQREDYYDNH